MKRLLRTLGGEAVWPPPVWLMRQAGRYLPEYRAVRAGVKDFVALCTTPELAAEVTLQPIRRYGFDAAILFSDILMLPWALGHGLEFKEGEGPVLPKLRDAAGVAALDPARVADRVAPIMETVRLVRAGLTTEGFGDTTLIGFAGAPFTVACYMVEGGGSKDFAHVRGMAYAQSGLFQRLMDVLTDASIEYLSAQVVAGAEALMLFELVGGGALAVAVPGPLRRAGGTHCRRAGAETSERASHWISASGWGDDARLCRDRGRCHWRGHRERYWHAGGDAAGADGGPGQPRPDGLGRGRGGDGV